MRQDSAGFARSLAALEARHAASGRQIILVLDNGPCHVSKATQAALAARDAWLEVIPLARSSPHRTPKERAWRLLKRDHRAHLAPSLRAFVDAAAAGLRGLGGDAGAIIDEVPQWWLDGHRKEPTGRPPGRPRGAKDRQPRQRRSTNVPAPPLAACFVEEQGDDFKTQRREIDDRLRHTQAMLDHLGRGPASGEEAMP